MYVTANEEFCFIAHPRTASRATGQALGLKSYGSTGHHEFNIGKCRQIVRLGGIVACTIRNPFDVVVSWYFNEHFNETERTREGDFKPWVIRTGLQHQQWLNCTISSQQWDDGTLYFYGLPVANRLLRFESLEANLKVLSLDAKLPYTPTKPYGVLPRDRDYRVYYDDETRALVEERFEQDLRLTGYTFDG